MAAILSPTHFGDARTRTSFREETRSQSKAWDVMLLIP